MTLRDIIERVEADPTYLRICSPDRFEDVGDRFGSLNVEIEHTPLPSASGEGFVIVRKHDEFLGSVSLGATKTFTSPRLGAPGELGDEEFSALLRLLDDTVFTSFDRRQMLATSREIEDRAWRLGRGQLYTGFQNADAMQQQARVYRQLATKHALDVHVYAAADAPVPELTGVTTHPSEDPMIAKTWFVVYQNDDPLDSCALLAEERSPGEFYGFWTYDPTLVTEIVDIITTVEDTT